MAVAVVAMCWGPDADRAFAQAPLFTLDALSIGACEVVVKIENARGGDRVGVVVDQTLVREHTVVAGEGTLRFGLTEALRPGSMVVVRVNGMEATGQDGKPMRVQLAKDAKDGGTGECETEADTNGEPPFLASFFLGEVVDNFAPDAVGNYKAKDPNEALKAKGSFIFGFDFDYRLHGRSNSRIQWWLEGETMHGVRTADVDCNPTDPKKKPPVCDDAPTEIRDRARYILKNATSLEVWATPRVEFHTLQGGTESPAKLYATLNLGFIALDDAPQDGVYRSHHFGMGLAADSGPFDKSFLEIGWGKNELFAKEWNRLKIDGLLSFSLERLPLWRDTGRLFVEMTIDNSLSDGPDSIRTFFGVDVDLKALSQ